MKTELPVPDKNNIQGLVFNGWTKYRSAHLLFRFSQASIVNEFVSSILPYVQSAAHWGPAKPAAFINVGFSFTGLLFTRVPLVEYDSFPIEFRLGPTNYYSQQTLCDLGTSSPGNWVFGNQDENKRVDCIVHCYGKDMASLQDLVNRISGFAARYGIAELLPVLPNNTGTGEVKQNAPTAHEARYYNTDQLDNGFIHFGYRDGISEPSKVWPPPPKDDPETLHNFLIGYPGSPISPGPHDTKKINSPTSTFAKDGTYYAFRVFYQDVEAFDRFLAQHAGEVAARTGLNESDAKEWLAAKLLGRWKSGTPLAISPDKDDPAYQRENKFDYSQDADGYKCPFSAHVRNTNTRSGNIFLPEEPEPRILRRGTAYGNPPSGDDYSGDRGLVGIFICGSLGEQFEKMNSWVNANNFSPLYKTTTQDALIGNRLAPHAVPELNIPLHKQKPLRFDLRPWQFVVTRGTAYCFLPSVATLKLIAASGKK